MMDNCQKYSSEIWLQQNVTKGLFWTLFKGFEMNSQAQEEPSNFPAEVKT